ncbi:exocyst complex component EXO70H1-like [Lolium rigidum]|uniref:exocyst complex component EXO70H1-like n=1 Tax=Lolium rigidum TaxID=89674 RepID=UPI001F5C7C53|nr:exocyst complex component EXO70H1-like [Lolium rigidum]
MTRAGTRSPLPPRRTLPATVVDDTVAAAAVLLDKWHPEESSSGRSLFLDSTIPDEADAFLRAAKDLHRAMLFYASGLTSKDLHGGGHGLIHAQELLDTAMRRLELELQILLSCLPDVIQFNQYDDNDEDVEFDQSLLTETCGHLRAVAEAMLAAGYGKECVAVFKEHRRASVAAALQRLHGFSPSQQLPIINKLGWEQIDARIQSWLTGARAAFASVFAGERDLCDRVFAGENASVGDAVFSAVVEDQAMSILAFAEAAVAKAKRAPERLFRMLDVHDALTETIIPAIVATFGDKSEVMFRAAELAVAKVGDTVRGMVAGFEAAIEKEPTKATAPGGAVHPLTRYVMNYLVVLADYENALANIYSAEQYTDTTDIGFGSGTAGSSSSDLSMASTSSFSSSSTQRTLSLWSNPIGWLVSVLMRKLDAKAGNYREAALSYLFLANNTHYVAKKVGGGTKLEAVLGEDWAKAQRAKARGYVDVYVRSAWGSKVLRGGAVDKAVIEAVAMQETWVAADEEMGEVLRAVARAAVVPTYRMFYRRQGAAARLTPGDVIGMIDRLFGGQTSRSHSNSLSSTY